MTPDTFTSHQYHPVQAQVTPHPESFLFPQGTTLGLRTTNRPTLCHCEGHSTFSSHCAVLQGLGSSSSHSSLGCHDCRRFSVCSTLSNNQRTSQDCQRTSQDSQRTSQDSQRTSQDTSLYDSYIALLTQNINNSTNVLIHSLST